VRDYYVLARLCSHVHAYPKIPFEAIQILTFLAYFRPQNKPAFLRKIVQNGKFFTKKAKNVTWYFGKHFPSLVLFGDPTPRVLTIILMGLNWPFNFLICFNIVSLRIKNPATNLITVAQNNFGRQENLQIADHVTRQGCSVWSPKNNVQMSWTVTMQ